MDERYEALVEARNHPDEQLAKLREDVDAARREFHALQGGTRHPAKPVSGASGRHARVRQGGVQRQGPRVPHDGRHDRPDAAHDDSEALAEERRRQREEAERRVYESRKNMWDAEKRLKAAEKALSDEDEREKRLKSERMQRRVKEAEQRAP